MEETLLLPRETVVTMKNRLLYAFVVLIILYVPTCAKDDTSWIVSQAQKLQEHLARHEHEIKSLKEQSFSRLSDDKKAQKPCASCTVNPKALLKDAHNTQDAVQNKSCIKILCSFSMPDQSLITLSQEAKRFGGTLVLQGLLSNSFAKTAEKIAQLQKQGFIGGFQIDPRIFKDLDIVHVPVFVKCQKSYDGSLTQGHGDLVHGNISLKYALDLFERRVP